MTGLSGLDDGQGLQIHAGSPQAVTAALEALLHGAADANQSGAGGIHDVAQAAHSLAVGHEVIDDEDLIVGGDPLLGHQQRDLLLIGVGEDVALVQAALDVVALGLLGKDHGLVEVLGHDGGQGDAGGLRREDHGDFIHVEVLAELLGDVGHQLRVDAVIQKAVHLDDVAGQHLAFLHDAVLQFLHVFRPPCVLFKNYDIPYAEVLKYLLLSRIQADFATVFPHKKGFFTQSLPPQICAGWTKTAKKGRGAEKCTRGPWDFTCLPAGRPRRPARCPENSRYCPRR